MAESVEGEQLAVVLVRLWQVAFARPVTASALVGVLVGGARLGEVLGAGLAKARSMKLVGFLKKMQGSRTVSGVRVRCQRERHQRQNMYWLVPAV